MSSSSSIPCEDPQQEQDKDCTLQEDNDALEETLLVRMGGWRGVVYSTLPVVVFVPVNAWKGLMPALWSAFAIAVVIFLLRLIRREKLTPAVSGLIAVALCAFIAYRMGNAKGYFVWGIWVSAAYAVISIISIVVRWPLIGVVLNLLNGHDQSWQKNKTSRYWYDLATFAWALVFAARFAIQQWLYLKDAATALGVTRIVMGWPLTIVAVVITVWAVKKTTREQSESCSKTDS